MESKDLKADTKLIRKIRYGLRPIFAFISILVITSFVIFASYHYLINKDPAALFVVCVALGLDIFVMTQVVCRRFIFLYDDKIIIQSFFKKDNTILNESIVGVKLHEYKGNLSIIVERRGDKDISIKNAFLKDIDFYEILEFIENLLVKKYSGEKPKSKEQQLEERRLKDRWQLGMYGASIVAIAGMIPLISVDTKGQLDVLPFAIYAVSFTSILMFFVWKQILPKVDHFISKGEQLFSYIMSLITPGIFLTGVLILVNMKFDSRYLNDVETKLTGEFVPKKKQGVLCYSLIDPTSSGFVGHAMGAYCTDEYPSAHEGAIVKGKLYSGFLGGKWIKIDKIQGRDER